MFTLFLILLVYYNEIIIRVNMWFRWHIYSYNFLDTHLFINGINEYTSFSNKWALLSIYKLICIIYILYDVIFWMCIVQRAIFISNRRYSWWKYLATRMKTWIEERNFCCFSDCIQIWVEFLVLKTVQIKIISVNETK